MVRTATLGMMGLVLGIVLGCGGESGPSTYPVIGNVTLDGTPVERGQIAFRDPSGQVPSAGAEITDGSYSLESQPGNMRVEITARREVPGKFEESNPGEKVPLLEQYIPSQFNTDSELTREIKAEANEFNFELKSSE